MGVHIVEWEKALGIYQAAVGEERAKQGLTLPLLILAIGELDLKVLRLKGNFDVKKSEQMHVMMCRLAEEN